MRSVRNCLVAALIWEAAVCRVAAEPREVALEGLDLVILVDVSRSMHTDPSDIRSNPAEEPASGSDPQRIRYDAVKLVADLLTPQDRMLVQRFNVNCPPKPAENYPAQYLAAGGYRLLQQGPDFPAELLLLSEENRKRLEAVIDRYNVSDDYAGLLDDDGTRIVAALQAVAARLGKPVPGRRMHVILLTDGKDNDAFPGDSQIAPQYTDARSLEAALDYYTGKRRGDDPIPIHTIGLATSGNGKCELDGVGEEFLLRLASMSGGGYHRAESNHDLIQIFVDLVRQLKGAWSPDRPYEVQPGDSLTVAPMPVTGIVDLGALAFEIDAQAPPKRRTYPPRIPVTQQWTDLAGAAEPSAVRRTSKRGSVYDYTYYGKSNADEVTGSPFKDLPVTARLGMQMHEAARPQKLTIMKRTHEPIFRVLEPREGAVFHRHQALEISVRLIDSEFFQPDDFQVRAVLTVAGGLPGKHAAPPLPPINLQLVPGSREFRGVYSLAQIRPGKMAADYYTLQIRALGKPGRPMSLAGDRHDLPSRVVTVNNDLLLESRPNEVELTHAARQIPINLRTPYPVLDDIVLRASFTAGQEESSKGCELTTADGPLVKGRLVLQRGTAEVKIGFASDALLPRGGVAYKPGLISITDPAGLLKENLNIPVKLVIGLARLKCSAETVWVEAKEQPTSSEALEIDLAGSEESEVDQMSVEIRRRAFGKSGPGPDKIELSAQELWLQAGEGDPQPIGRRSQRISISRKTPFRIRLYTMQTLEPGKHDYEIVARGRGAEELRIPVQVVFSPPKLEVRQDAVTVYLSPQGAINGAFEVKLHGVGRRSDAVLLAPKGNAFRFERLEGTQAATEPRFEVEMDRTSVTTGRAGWTAVPFTVQSARPVVCGRYRCSAALEPELAAPVAVTINVVVNALVVESPWVAPDGLSLRWRPAEEIPMLHLFDYPAHKVIRVRTALNDPLSSKQVRIEALRPYQDDSGDAVLLPRLVSAEPFDGGKSLLAQMVFPDPVNAHPGKPAYRLKIRIEAPEAHVQPVVLELRTHFCRVQDLLEIRSESNP